MTTATGAQAFERTPLWDALVAMVLPGLVLAVVYWLAGTWSVSRMFGGEDDRGYVDFQGRPTDEPPLVAHVAGQPAAWVFLVLALILLATSVWVSRTGGRSARHRAWIGSGAAAAFVIAVVLVFSVLQLHLVQEAFAHGSTHPPILGNATLTVAREVEAG